MGIAKQPKVVHWVDDIPSTPSPTYSTTSLPSSPAVSTPPQQPWKELPQSSAAAGLPTRIHPLLGVNPDINHPSLVYDVSQPPTSVRRRDSSVQSNLVAEPATWPPLPSLTIHCPSLPWDIVIQADPHIGFVTASKVFEGIYASLRRKTTEAEFVDIPSKSHQHATVKAYRDRCAKLQDPASELQKGMRRVDFLCGRTRFLGLAATKKSPSDWELQVA